MVSHPSPHLEYHFYFSQTQLIANAGASALSGVARPYGQKGALHVICRVPRRRESPGALRSLVHLRCIKKWTELNVASESMLKVCEDLSS